MIAPTSYYQVAVLQVAQFMLLSILVRSTAVAAMALAVRHFQEQCRVLCPVSI